MGKGISVRAFATFDALATIALSLYRPDLLLLKSKVLTFFTLLCLTTSWAIVYHSQIWPKLLSPLRQLPAPPGASFWNGQFGRIRKEETGMPMRDWIDSVPNDGLMTYGFWLNTERVLLTTPDALREVLVTKSYDFEKPQLARSSLGRLLGFGVLLAEGDEHKFQRKNLMPAFAFRHVKNQVPIFWAKSAEMLRAIDKENEGHINSDDGAVVKVSEWASRCTLDIIGTSGMSIEFHALQNPDTELNKIYRSVFNPSKQARYLELLAAFFPLRVVRMLPVARNAMISDSVKVIRRISGEVIQEKKRKLALQEEKGSEPAEKDILSVALESGAFTDENLVDQVMTFLAAGHETTSTATTWAMLALSRHPEVQAKLREEVRENLPSPSDEDATVTAEQLESLHYLHAVCHEVLRFYPPVPMTRRVATHDTEILGQKILKGTDIILAPVAINWSKKLWGEDAHEFKPERWLGKNANSGGASSNFAHLTFLHGPRSCIGQRFAQIEFECILASLVGRYEFELYPKDLKIEVFSGVTSRPKNGLEVKMKAISGW